MMGYQSSKYGSAEDRLRLVREELNALPGQKRDLGNKYQICCPYHNDSNPSALITLDPLEQNGPIGWLTCLGCGKSVGWNALASTLNLKKMGRPKELKAEHFSEPKSFKEELFTKRKESGTFSELEYLDIGKPFPFKEWRGVDVKLLYAVGAQYAHNRLFNRYYILLPVNVNGKMRGYVKAEIEKPDDGRPSYLNAKADNGFNWSRKWGLIYFDYAVQIMKDQGLKTMVLCEGPRDSLRYLKQNIPAVSVLGALNWTANKRELLEDAGVEKIILSFDGDDAGIAATKFAYKDCKLAFDTKYLALWKKRVPRLDEKGKQQWKMRGEQKVLLWDNELDPFNMPDRFVEMVGRELV